MNSNQRVAKVFAGEVPDRVPIGEFAIDFDTVEKIIGRPTYLRAKAKSKIAFWENRHDEVAESYAKDHIELHEKLGFDIINFPMATWAIRCVSSTVHHVPRSRVTLSMLFAR